jgi:hypothetical protein
LEGRLGEASERRESSTTTTNTFVAPGPVVAVSGTTVESSGPSLATEAAVSTEGGNEMPWPDEAAEYSFLSESRERGEPVVAKRADAEGIEETNAQALPPLDELVGRIPAEVREVLEDLFRARFVTVKRIPKKALKT